MEGKRVEKRGDWHKWRGRKRRKGEEAGHDSKDHVMQKGRGKAMGIEMGVEVTGQGHQQVGKQAEITCGRMGE